MRPAQGGSHGKDATALATTAVSSRTSHSSREERRCLVVDAQPTLRLGIRELLEDRYEIAEASDWEKAVEMVTQVGDFDVAIVDMCRRDGSEEDEASIAAIKALRRARSGLGIVAHALTPQRLAATDALNAGATAYVAKSSDPGALAEAVDAAAESERFVDPAARHIRGTRNTSLTRRQRQILQMFADGRGTSDVARRLDLSSETVRVHTRGILSRLGARDRAHAVAKAMRAGIIS
jgi:DNA-binding NarL/FixJ family response regulator